MSISPMIICEIQQNILSVYPNPAKDQIKLNVLLIEENDTVQIQLQDITLHSKAFSHQMSLKKLVSGVYFVKIQSGTESFIQKVVLE